MAINTFAQERSGALETNRKVFTQSPWQIRPFLHSDTDNLCAYFNGLTRSSLRQRFQYSMESVHPLMLKRYNREIYPSNFALVAYTAGESSEICGEALLACNLVNGESEFAISVGDQFQRQGLGRALVKQLFKLSIDMGMLQIYADTLRSNHGFIALAESMGYSRQNHPDDWRQSRFVIQTNLTERTRH